LADVLCYGVSGEHQEDGGIDGGDIMRSGGRTTSIEMIRRAARGMTRARQRHVVRANVGSGAGGNAGGLGHDMNSRRAT